MESNLDITPTSLANEVRAAIRRTRMQLGYSQEYMAVQLGMSGPRQYSRIETGAVRLSIELLGRILAVLQIDLLQLLQAEQGSAHVLPVLRERVAHLEEEVIYLRDQLTRVTGR